MRYVVLRVVASAAMAAAATLVVFLVAHTVPADPVLAQLGDKQSGNPETVARFRARWGLDRPLHEQYALFLGRLARGDLGESIASHRPVLDDIRQYVPATIELATAAGPGPTTTTTTGNNPGGGCRASQRVTSQWQGGYGAEIVIENRGAALTGWTFTFSAPGVTVTQGWNGTWNDTGDVVRVGNASWNGSVPAGGQVSIGYNANYSGTTPPFASPALNGIACS